VAEAGKLVYSLSIDLIGSTQAGLKLTSTKLDSFNKSLVEQIEPHLKGLGLEDILIKFTGDGWLLMTEKEEKLPGLCCLAIIMSSNFQSEMSKETGIQANQIPQLRLAICTGRDISVRLPYGRL
jgi:hypothetical protein